MTADSSSAPATPDAPGPEGSLFLHTVVLLLAEPVSGEALEAALEGMHPARRDGMPDQNPWVTPGVEYLVPMRPESGGWVVVDHIGLPWPDRLGDDGDALAAEAKSAGFFGRHVWPEALSRAVQQRWGWPDADKPADAHRACVRLRTTYAIGSGVGEPPEDRDSMAELHFLCSLALRLGQQLSALAVFLPAAEVLRSVEQARDSLSLLEHEHYLPLDLWMNTRIFGADDAPEFTLMDCVGLNQLGFPDLELVFEKGRFDLDEIDLFIRQIAARCVADGRPPAPGTELQGPDGSMWSAMGGRRPTAEPERRFRRLCPVEIADFVLRAALFSDE